MKRRDFCASIACMSAIACAAGAQQNPGRFFLGTAIIYTEAGSSHIVSSHELGELRSPTWAGAAKIAAERAREIVNEPWVSMTLTLEVQPEPRGL